MNESYNFWYVFWILIDLLCYRFEKFSILYQNTIGKAYKKEFENFQLSDSKKILHIGSGAYPLTAIMFTKYLPAHIVSIDKNSVAVKLSKKLIHKKKLNNKITIDKSDGSSYPLSNFDTVIISGCSVPIFDLLNYVFLNSNKDCKIIIRLNEKQYHQIIDFIDNYDNIEIVKEMDNIAYPKFKWISLLLINKLV
jgi:hypothetical protein